MSFQNQQNVQLCKMLPIEIGEIAAEEVQEYIFSHAEEDEGKLLLKDRTILGVPTGLIAHQIRIRRKAETKLPLFFKTKGVIYPPTLNWEQCSSEATGNFKAQIVTNEIGEHESKIADLTGGFGIDSLFLGKRAASLDYIEPDPVLLNLARHNHDVLGCTSIHYHHTTAEEFLDRDDAMFDLIYLDPSRRNLSSKKVFRLEDCQPNTNHLLQQILDRAKFALIKTSPLLDIRQGLSELTAVKKIIVVSVNNECKELLFLLQKDFSGEPIVETYNLSKGGSVNQSLSFSLNDEKSTESDFGEPQTYLYEPNSSILKAGAFKIIGKKFLLRKLQVNTHLYTSDELHADFPGRIFKIDQHEFDSKNFVEKKANVITRNYPLGAEALRRKLRLSDGGNKYVIGFSAARKKYVVMATRLV